MHGVSDRLVRLTGRIRPEERSEAAGAFLTLLGFSAGHALLETARDALFLARLPAARLPWVYLAIAVIALGLAEHQSRFLRRFSFRDELSRWLAFSSLVTLLFWIVVRWAGVWIFYALYIWTGVLATLVIVRFWTLLGGELTVTQAKRLYAIVGSGAALGAILGSGLARLLTGIVPARDLVLAAALVFLVAAFGPGLLGRRPEAAWQRSRGIASARQLSRVAGLIWSRPYLKRVAVLILVGAVTVTLVDFVFKTSVDRAIPPGQLGSFFATVYLVLNTASLAVQLVIVSWLIRGVGVNKALAVVPSLLIVGALGVTFGGGLLMALALKGVDGSLRHSLSRTGTELFFIPLPVELRVRVKPVIDVLGQRGGQALASVLILVLLTVTVREAPYAALAAVTATAWLFLVLDLRRHYLNVFRESLSQEIAGARWELPDLNLPALEGLLKALNDSDEARVIAALEVLSAYDKLSTVPALILHHPSPRVIATALGLFTDAKRADILAVAGHLRSHPDARVRAALVRAEIVFGADEQIVLSQANDPAREVRATALCGLVAMGSVEAEEAARALVELVRTGRPEERLAIARAIHARPVPALEDTLAALMNAPEEDVCREALRGVAAFRSHRFVARLIESLAVRSLREEARASLVGLGPSIFPRLAAALADPELGHSVRRHLPDVIAAFGTAPAAELLVGRLPDEPDGMIRFKILRALGRLRRRQPGLPLDTGTLSKAQTRTLSIAFQFLGWRRSIEREAARRPETQTDLQRLLVALLRDKQQHALERLFRALNLETRNDDFFRIYRGLQSPAPKARAGSRELLEHLVPARSRGHLLTLIDDLYEPEFTAPESLGPHMPKDLPTALRGLLHAPAESLSSLAAAHIAELGLVELRGEIDGLLPLSEDHAQLLERSSAALASVEAR